MNSLLFAGNVLLTISCCQVKKIRTDHTVFLWNRFCNGDEAAFTQLMQLFYPDLFQYGMRFCLDRDLVKDCLQEVFLYLWNKHATLQGVVHVKTYLLTAVRRKIKKEAEKRRSRPVQLSPDFMFDAGFETGLPADHALLAEEGLRQQVLLVRRLLGTLTRRQQEVIYLRFYMEATITDIAAIMSLNPQSVYNLLHDALKKIRSVYTLPEMENWLPLLALAGMALFC